MDTGLDTMTGGRVKRVQKYIGNEPFMLTYGDGVSDINIKGLCEFHKKHQKMLTISAYNVEQRFGVLDINEEGQITAFREKAANDGSMVNMGCHRIKSGIHNGYLPWLRIIIMDCHGICLQIKRDICIMQIIIRKPLFRFLRKSSQ